MGSPEFPKNARWALSDLTMCGQQGYLRPCQLRDCDDLASAAVPLADICTTANEMVFVVDDDGDLREELVEMVRAQGYTVTGLASANALQAVAQQYTSGCILLDIRLPGQDGVSVQDWLNSVDSLLPVIFISGVKDVSTVVHCMKAGAVEFLAKPFGEMALRQAVNMAVGVSRQRYCMKSSQRMVGDLIATLTPTEVTVAKMISRGYATKMIATEMGRSENTVKIHRHHIFRKLMVNSAASVGNLMRHAMMLGFDS